jgi:DNA-directed RNA polymerase subunit RPC12/RpoP
MSVIPCPECRHKISSNAKICSHCGHQFGDVTQDELDVYRARQLRDHIYRLSMASYAVITVFLAGFGWYWATSDGFTRAISKGPVILMAAAALAYLAVRALLFRARQKRKALKQKRLLSRELRRNL